MKNCKNCAFCKRDLINDYIREADLYKCDMDGDMILDPLKECQNCTWYKGKGYKRSNAINEALMNLFRLRGHK